MNTRNRTAIFALVAAGTLWGLTVPLSKLALGWLSPGWLTVARFVLAAPGLAVLGRRGLRDACTPGVIAAGAFGFGGEVLGGDGCSHGNCPVWRSASATPMAAAWATLIERIPGRIGMRMRASTP